MRIIVPDQAGVRSAKWIKKIEVRETPSNAPIQAKDYKLFPPSVAKDEAEWDEGLTIERMPVSSALPYEWYNTPNIHLCTVQDFETHCRKHGIRILERQVINRNHRTSVLSKWWPNLFGEIAIYRVTV